MHTDNSGLTRDHTTAINRTAAAVIGAMCIHIKPYLAYTLAKCAPTSSGLSSDHTTSIDRTPAGGSGADTIAPPPGCCALSAAWCRCTFGGTPMPLSHNTCM